MFIKLLFSLLQVPSLGTTILWTASSTSTLCSCWHCCRFLSLLSWRVCYSGSTVSKEACVRKGNLCCPGLTVSWTDCSAEPRPSLLAYPVSHVPLDADFLHTSPQGGALSVSHLPPHLPVRLRGSVLSPGNAACMFVSSKCSSLNVTFLKCLKCQNEVNYF